MSSLFPGVPVGTLCWPGCGGGQTPEANPGTLLGCGCRAPPVPSRPRWLRSHGHRGPRGEDRLLHLPQGKVHFPAKLKDLRVSGGQVLGRSGRCPQTTSQVNILPVDCEEAGCLGACPAWHPPPAPCAGRGARGALGPREETEAAGRVGEGVAGKPGAGGLET